MISDADLETPATGPKLQDRAVVLRAAAFPLRYLVIGLLVFLVISVTIHSIGNLALISLIIINCIAALGLSLMLGLGALLTIGQAALMAVGAYSCGILIEHSHWPFVAAALTAVMASGLVSAAVGWVGVRIGSHYFILVTLGLSAAVIDFINNETSLTGGAAGLSGLPPLEAGHYQVTGALAQVAVCLIALMILWYLAECFRRSRAGRAALAVSTNTEFGIACGVRPHTSKVGIAFVGGAYAGVAGVLFAGTIQYLGPADFGLGQAILLLLGVVVGGIGSNWGTIVGTALVIYLAEGLTTLTVTGQLVYGAIVILVLLLARGGLAELATRSGSFLYGHFSQRFLASSMPMRPWHRNVE